MQAKWVSTMDRKLCFLTPDAPGYMCSKAEVSNIAVNTSELSGPLVCNDKLSGITCFIVPTSGITYYTAINLYAKWIRACVYLYFKGSPTTIKPTTSTATNLRRALHATSISMSFRTACNQWKALSVISIYVILLIPIFNFDFNL